MDITRIKAAVSRLMRKKWVWFILVIAAIWTASQVWDYFKLLSGQTPMYDVAIKLKVGDELVEINRTVPCEKEYRGEFYYYLLNPSKWSKWPFSYIPRDLSTGAELSDGSGVIVALPLACKLVKAARTKGESGNLLPEDFLPVIALLDNADDPQVATFILSRSYYRRPDKEVDLLKYTATPSDKFTFPSFPDSFNWLQGLGMSNELHFATQYLLGMPATEFWRGHLDRMPGDEVTKPVSIYDLPEFNFPPELREKFENEPFPKIGEYLGGIGFGVGQESVPDAENLSVDHAIPVVRTPEGDTYDSNQKGYLVFYRQRTDKNPFLRRIAVEGELKENEFEGLRPIKIFYEYDLVKDGANISAVYELFRQGQRRKIVREPFFYDPESKSVYWVKSEVWDFPDLR